MWPSYIQISNRHLSIASLEESRSYSLALIVGALTNKDTTDMYVVWAFLYIYLMTL